MKCYGLLIGDGPELSFLSPGIDEAEAIHQLKQTAGGGEGTTVLVEVEMAAGVGTRQDQTRVRYVAGVADGEFNIARG